MSFWLTKSFRALQRAWYGRLAAEGFEDAEELVGDDLKLKQHAERALVDETHLREGREDYYRMLRCLSEVEAFDSDIDKIIVTMTAEGARQREIEARLNALGIRRPPRFLSEKRRCRESIRLTVRKYERRWGLRQDEREAG